MPMSNINNKTAQGLVKLLIIGLSVQLLVIGYVLYQSYAGRVDLVKSERAGCGRGKLDRVANARGWRAAEAVRISSVMNDLHVTKKQVMALIVHKPAIDDPPDLVAARNYNGIATGLEKRSKISCAKAFPKASLLP